MDGIAICIIFSIQNLHQFVEFNHSRSPIYLEKILPNPNANEIVLWCGNGGVPGWHQATWQLANRRAGWPAPTSGKSATCCMCMRSSKSETVHPVEFANKKRRSEQ
jgi:hypothetical protein